VAVSGGSDSLALLLLAHAWAQTRDFTLHAVTIDHGLRPEAAAEAAFVAALCDGLEIDHTTLAWEGVKPPSGLAEAARRARYALIEEFALDIGCDMILTGHTEDDQAETVWMRVRRGQGASLGRGLSGMGRTVILPGGTMMARPLISVSRARLRSYLASFPQSWVEDPTNEDTTYERVRIRRQLAANPQLRRQLLDFNSTMTRWRALLSRDTAALLQHLVSVRPGPVLGFDLSVALAAPPAVLVHAVQVLLAASGGAEHLAPRTRVESVIEGFSAGDTGRTTLAGSVVERDGAGIRFYREVRNIDSCFVDPGETVVWDGRMEIANGSRQRIHVGPLTRAGLVEIEQVRKAGLAGRPRAALHSSALIRTHDGRAFLPMLETDGQPPLVHTRLTARAIEHFCPETDLPLIEWLRGMEVARRACLTPRQ
jgi:tRNA(Ile)-lysidine synthase